MDPAPYQREILMALERERRVLAWGPHGLGKTAVAAWAVLTFAAWCDGRWSWKAATTASVWRQLEEYLWPEIAMWAPKLVPPHFSTQSLHLKGSTGFAFAVASGEPGKIEGAHAEKLLYVLDEAKTIPQRIWRAVFGALSTGDTYVLAISTPPDAPTEFYRQARSGKWWKRHVTLQEALAAGRVSPRWVEEMEENLGVDDPEFKRRVLGEFAYSSEHAAVSMEHVLRAQERGRALEDWGPPICIGVDVAREGGDRTVLAYRYQKGILRLEILPPSDLMLLARALEQRARAYHVPLVVDATGIGAGLYDRLRELGVNVIPFMAAARPSNTDGIRRFANLRAQAWWSFARALAEEVLALPDHDGLAEELCALGWVVRPDGSLQLASKSGLDHSPDLADACVMAWALEMATRGGFDVL